MNNPEILIAEGDEILRRSLKEELFRHGFEFTEAPNKTDVSQFFQKRKPDLVIVGSSTKSNVGGPKIVEEIRQWDREVPVILITRHSSEAQIIEALRAGVNDYFKVPFSYEELVASVKRYLPEFSPKSSPKHKTIVPDNHIDKLLIGNSAAMQEIKSYLLKVAKTDSTVLITGESGTGKELVAEFISHNSSRQAKPLVSINCAALPESLLESELFGYERGAFTGAVVSKTGKFEQAMGGTVFLDEIRLDEGCQARPRIL